MELNEALKQVVSRRGQDVLTDGILLSLLLDLQAFDSRPAAKQVLKVAQSDGTMAKLLAVGEWNAQSLKLMDEFVHVNGFQGDLVAVVFDSVAYGLGWTPRTTGGSASSPQGAKNSSGGSKSQGRPSLAFDRSKLPPRLRLLIDNIVKNMVWVEGGTFMMGATPEQEPAYASNLTNSQFDDEYPPHQVTLDSFFISKYLVTQRDWGALMGESDNSNRPKFSVSRDDCDEFIDKLEQLSGLKFRLPTEAEWEFAARGGNHSQHTMYAGSNDCSEVAYFSKIKRYNNNDVGEKKPNELGLYDMSGLAWEWCEDVYGPYSQTAVVNPRGARKGDEYVLRGGSWSSDKLMCRTTTRYHLESWIYIPISDEVGFRLAL